jgi:hypothetical protein
MGKNKGKNTVADLAGQLIAGTNKHLSSVTQVLLEGGAFTPAQITGKLEELVVIRTDVEAAQAATKAKLAIEAAQGPALRTFLGAFVTFLRAAFGNQPSVLADFGLHPKKAPTPLTVEQKAAATAKRKATRAARHTQGPKQKKGVKGTVIGVTVIPIVAPEPVATAVPAAQTAPVNTTGAATGGATPH